MAGIPGQVLRKRIARKILLGYVVPLAVLLVAGLLVPVAFWSYLSRADTAADSAIHIADHVTAMRQATYDSASALRGYVRYHDETFRTEIQDAHDRYRDNYRDTMRYIDTNPDESLRASLEMEGAIYRRWRIHTVLPLMRAVDRDGVQSQAVESARSALVGTTFQTVAATTDALLQSMQEVRGAQAQRAEANDTLRLIIAVTVPGIAALLAALIARLNTLGITRPLEALTVAAEMLEQGEIARVILAEDGPYPDDEIGDLQQAFRRMARTIGQREAILRAQNEAVGALNRRVEAVLNATNDAIVMLDRGGGFSVVNERFAQLFGIEPEVLLDHTFAQASMLFLSRFRGKEAVRARFEEVLFDPEAIVDETYEIMEPAARTLRMYSAPVRGGGIGDTLDSMDAAVSDQRPDVLGRIFVFRDVTRETAVDRMKTEFVSTVSHELRTPLTAIRGYVDLMANGQTGPLTDVQREFLGLVQASTRRLTSLINDMLDMSRIESGRITLKRDSVDYLVLVQETVRMMAGAADKKGVALQVEIVGDSPTDGPVLAPPAVTGDGDRITQVLFNLISNGIKYTPSGGRVTVQVEYEGDFVTTCVADTGIGISREDQKHLFQKFFRADNSTTREAGGTGLGLAITRAILEKLNGSVWVESEPGKGSRFYFTLPTTLAAATRQAAARNGDAAAWNGAAVDADEATPVPEARPALPRKLILTIDSDPSALHRLGHALRQGEYAISTAATTPDALRRAQSLRPDLITLDPLTPRLDGLGLLRSLREHELLRDTPVAFVSIRSLGADRGAEMRDNVAVLPKPVDGDTLCALALQALAQSGAEVPAVVVVGPAALVESVRRMAASMLGAGSTAADPNAPPPIRLLSAAAPEEAERFVGDPSLSLVILDAEAAPGRRAAHLATALYGDAFTARIPIIVITDAPVARPRTAPLIPFGSGAAPITELGMRLEAFLEARRPAPEPEEPAVTGGDTGRTEEASAAEVAGATETASA